MAYDRFISYQAQNVNTGAAAVPAALGEVLQSFSDSVRRNVIEPGIVRQAGLEGAAAGAKGAPPPLQSDLTLRGRAFNDAAVRSYIGATVADIEDQAAKLEAEAGDDPEKFTATMKGMQDGILGGSSQGLPEARPAITAFISSRTNEGRIRLANAQRKKVAEQQQYDDLRGDQALRGAIARKLAMPDPAQHAEAQVLIEQLSGRIQGRVGVSISAEQAIAYESQLLDGAIADVQAAQIEQRVAPIMAAAREDVGAIGRGLAGLASDPTTPPELLAAVTKEIRSQQELLQYQRKQEFAPQLADLSERLARGDANPGLEAQIDGFYRRAALSPSEQQSMRDQLARNQVAGATRAAVSDETMAYLTAGLPLDPGNSEHRKALDAVFTQQTQTFAMGSQPWMNSAQALAQRTRMLPGAAQGWLRASARSPDPAVAVKAAQFFGSLEQASPEAAGNIDADTKVFLSTVQSMISAGSDPTLAFQTARANVFETRPDVRVARQKAYGGHAKESAAALDSFIDRDMDTPWRSQPGASELLQSDFERQTQEYFVRGADIDSARELAWKDMTRVYGETRVNGEPVVQMFPVERFGVKPEEVRAEIAAAVKGLPGVRVRPEDILVVPDGVTQRAITDALTGKAVMPSYRLMTRDGEPIFGPDGVPLRYTLPGGDELAGRVKAAEEKARAEAEAQVEAARQQRAIEQARAARAARPLDWR